MVDICGGRGYKRCAAVAIFAHPSRRATGATPIYRDLIHRYSRDRLGLAAASTFFLTVGRGYSRQVRAVGTTSDRGQGHVPRRVVRVRNYG